MASKSVGGADLTVGEVLNITKSRVNCYIEDVLPITVAVADPTKIKIGVSIQRDYPLTKIERVYGIPFGRLKTDAKRVISDPDELHGCKWGIEVHETIFQGDAMNEEYIRTGRREGRVVIALSTGMGNILQNLRSLAYANRALYMVEGEEPDHPPPYACLVEYLPGHEQPNSSGAKLPMGVELLLFNESGAGCQRVDKKQYFQEPSQAVLKAKADFEHHIRWAVSGYPLRLDGESVALETTALNVSDFRHVWRLPKLQRSLVQHLASISDLPEERKGTIEFYFGFEEIRHAEYFVPATRGFALTLPLALSLTRHWRENVFTVCRISEEKLESLENYDSGRSKLFLKPEDVEKDFEDIGCTRRLTKDEVLNPGDFCIHETDDNDNRWKVSVRLLPAVYPHHIVGISKGGKVVNISIGGLSGRSGITIDNAKQLCEEIGLVDALIFDNGNDVFARVGGGAVICHRGNPRQTRVTAAFQFGYLLGPAAFGGQFEGLELAYSTCEVTPKQVPKAQRGAALAMETAVSDGASQNAGGRSRHSRNRRS